MAFGFSPKYQREIPLDDLTREHFLVLGIESSKKLGWNIGPIAENGFVAYTRFSMGSWSEEVSIKIDGASAQLRSECAGSQLFDWGKNKENIEGFIKTFQELRTQLTIPDLDLKSEELRTKSASEGDNPVQSPFATKKGFKNVLSLFVPTEGYFITPIIIDLNIAIFLAMVASGVSVLQPGGEILIKWGANFRPVTLDGQIWRLFTSCFLHIGVIHLLMNMYALAYVGVLLEPLLGKSRFATAYILTGVLASSASIWWHDLTISAGASGAIFGLYGVFLSMLTTDLIEKTARKALITSVVIFVSYNLLNGLQAGVDNAAHIGGLLSGIAIGFVFIPSLRDNDERDRKLKAIFLVVILSFGGVFAAYKSIRNDIGEYDKRIQAFVDYEEQALGVFSLSTTTPKELQLAVIRDKGIDNWNESIALLKELDKLKLPDVIHERDAKLIEYCQLRLESYELLYKGVKEETDQYQNKIDSLNVKIEGIVNSLKTEK